MGARTFLRCKSRALRGCTSGLAYVEFALALPVLLTLGLFGLETANFAMAHLRVSNIAVMTADNAARIRDNIDEADVIDLLTGAKETG
ncbi:MAG: TadE/TadG family type IV pilus assembly protein, partial [Sphingosinicella sp.]